MHQALKGGGDFRKYNGSPQPGAYRFKAFGKKGSENISSILLPPLIKQLNGPFSQRKKSQTETMTIKSHDRGSSLQGPLSTKSFQPTDEEVLRKLREMRTQVNDKIIEDVGNDPRLKH